MRTRIMLLLLCAVLSSCTIDSDQKLYSKPSDDGYDESPQSELENIISTMISPDTVIIFEDPVIEAIARFSLLLGETNDITVRDALSMERLGIVDEYWIEYFDAKGNAISTLNDLRWFENLKELHMIGCGLTSLEGIEVLGNLKVLDISQNRINDISPLSVLTNLESIRCNNNYLTDVSPLQNLPALRKLDLYNNKITDLSPLFGHSSLDAVCVIGNPLPPEVLDGVMGTKRNLFMTAQTTMIVNRNIPPMIVQAITYEDKNGDVWTDYLRIINSQTDEVINDIVLYTECFKGDAIADDNIFLDMNFDDYTDILLEISLEGAYAVPYCWYIFWDADENCFIINNIFVDAMYWSFDNKKQLVYSMSKDGAANHWYGTHKYIDGELVMIEKVSDISVWYEDIIDEIAIIIPEILEIKYPNAGIQHIVIEKLNLDTHEWEIEEIKYQLYTTSWELVKEFDATFGVGKKLLELIESYNYGDG